MRNKKGAFPIIIPVIAIVVLLFAPGLFKTGNTVINLLNNPLIILFIFIAIIAWASK